MCRSEHLGVTVMLYQKGEVLNTPLRVRSGVSIDHGQWAVTRHLSENFIFYYWSSHWGAIRRLPMNLRCPQTTVWKPLPLTHACFIFLLMHGIWGLTWIIQNKMDITFSEGEGLIWQSWRLQPPKKQNACVDIIIYGTTIVTYLHAGKPLQS